MPYSSLVPTVYGTLEEKFPVPRHLNFVGSFVNCGKIVWFVSCEHVNLLYIFYLSNVLQHVLSFMI